MHKKKCFFRVKRMRKKLKEYTFELDLDLGKIRGQSPFKLR